MNTDDKDSNLSNLHTYLYRLKMWNVNNIQDNEKNHYFTFSQYLESNEIYLVDSIASSEMLMQSTMIIHAVVVDVSP